MFRKIILIAGASICMLRVMSVSTRILGGMLAAFVASASSAQTVSISSMSAPAAEVVESISRPVARDPYLPAARWDDIEDAALWTRVAMSAFAANAPEITDVVPRDIETWCPAYVDADEEQRRAFWVGMMSALAYHESRFLPHVAGGPDLWFGVMQIYPPTARGYECRATTGNALRDPTENLSCATRIMAVTVPRDEAVAVHDGRWRGVAADWGPMVSRSKRNDMIEWTRAQNYCIPAAMLSVPIPPARPEDLLASQAVFDVSIGE